MIFNIQKCSIHDGSGLRTLVFFKGCPMKCLWCANPESQSWQAEIMELSRWCIKCGACKRSCPEAAVKLDSDEFTIDRSLCSSCFKCTDICYAGAKRVAGRDYSVEELFTEIEKDRLFYSMYGGGVTFSGGEPLAQPAFLAEIAARCHKSGINVAIESCGYAAFDEFKDVLPYIDQMFFDIKHIDSHVHKSLTGQGNELILDNVKRIADFGVPITVRTPVIPGYNDGIDNITGISEFISAIPGVRDYELLPYHNLGESKYNSLGIPYALRGVKAPSDEKMKGLVKCANKALQVNGKNCFYVKDNRKETTL